MLLTARYLRLKVLGALAIASVLAMSPRPAPAEEIVLTEPVHGVSFLPVYVAMKKGYFKDEGIDVKLVTMTGAAFVNAVITGQAFAFLGSVDHNAFAKVNGKDLKAVSNLVARANIYIMARLDHMPLTTDVPTFLKGKRIATQTYGRTPSNVLRYFLNKWNLEPGKDVTLVEVDSHVVPTTVRARQADAGTSSEPFISQAKKQGIWGDPIFNTAKELGPYADTAVSVRGDSIEKNPKLVKGLVKAVLRGLVYVNTHKGEMVEFSKGEFPTASEEDLKAALNRAFEDQIFSTDGFIPPQAWATGEAVVRQANILKEPVGYDAVIDMRFVTELQKELGISPSAR
jgi:NitT/TauT family transport system substrate-binding protein